jgi:hypothetical protein
LQPIRRMYTDPNATPRGRERGWKVAATGINLDRCLDQTICICTPIATDRGVWMQICAIHTSVTYRWTLRIYPMIIFAIEKKLWQHDQTLLMYLVTHELDWTVNACCPNLESYEGRPSACNEKCPRKT